MKFDPDNDPNDAYEVKRVPAEMGGPPPDWWMVTSHGIPVYFFSPNREAEAHRYATDPEYRRSRIVVKLHDRERPV